MNECLLYGCFYVVQKLHPALISILFSFKLLTRGPLAGNGRAELAQMGSPGHKTSEALMFRVIELLTWDLLDVDGEPLVTFCAAHTPPASSKLWPWQ